MTTEPVDPASGSTRAITYFWESGHYRKSLGDAIVQTLLADDEPVAGQLGRPLRPETVEAALAAARQARDAFSRARPELSDYMGQLTAR